MPTAPTSPKALPASMISAARWAAVVRVWSNALHFLYEVSGVPVNGGQL
jgi:hypothetical protein